MNIDGVRTITIAPAGVVLPTPGRIVLFNSDGTFYPAVVVRAVRSHDDPVTGKIDLVILGATPESFDPAEVRFSVPWGVFDGEWSWPRREEPEYFEPPSSL